MVKAVFFDIDGTLVSFKTHTIPQSTLDALAALKKKGIKVFIATGRPFSVIDNLGDLVFDGYITVNGACCLTAQQEIIYKNTVPVSNIESLVRYMDSGKDIFPCMIATADEIFINYIDDNVRKILKLIDFAEPQERDLSEAIGKDVLQLMGFFGNNQEKRIMPEVLPDCDTTRWNPLFTDIIAKGNSKQVGMDKMLDYFGIDLKYAMAFGDGGNDIPMLRHAPLSVAMGNAGEDVKKEASYITDSVDDNGVWNALKYFEII